MKIYFSLKFRYKDCSSKVTAKRRGGVSLSCCCHQVRGKCVVSSVALSRDGVEGVSVCSDVYC